MATLRVTTSDPLTQSTPVSNSKQLTVSDQVTNSIQFTESEPVSPTATATISKQITISDPITNSKLLTVTDGVTGTKFVTNSKPVSSGSDVYFAQRHRYGTDFYPKLFEGASDGNTLVTVGADERVVISDLRIQKATASADVYVYVGYKRTDLNTLLPSFADQELKSLKLVDHVAVGSPGADIKLESSSGNVDVYIAYRVEAMS